MKKNLLALIFCLLCIHFNAASQTSLKLTTATMDDVKNIILPTFGNLSGLLTADQNRFLATMKQYKYTDDDNSKIEYYKSTTDVIRNKDEQDGLQYVTLEYNDLKAPEEAALHAMEDDIKRQFPNAVVTENEASKIYDFDVKSPKGNHHYKAYINTGNISSASTNPGGSATLKQVN
ncbi:MAG: hypothetical protein ABI378_00450 [Chitinophagaceae bacterium]